jgi:hypothetical protein
MTVYSGPIEALRLIESRLEGLGFKFQRLSAPHNLGGGSAMPESTLMLEFRLAMPRADFEASRETVLEIIRSGGWDEAASSSDPSFDLDGVPEVLACPECLLFLACSFPRCPGCDAALTPAVEIFEAEQFAPDRVIVAAGSPDRMREAETRLKSAGFHPDAFAVEGWEPAAVDLAWSELLERGDEVADLLPAQP